MLQTDDLELKKLVYLYLINYAKTQPDLAIMGVNTFVKVRPHLTGTARAFFERLGPLHSSALSGRSTSQAAAAQQ